MRKINKVAKYQWRARVKSKPALKFVRKLPLLQGHEAKKGSKIYPPLAKHEYWEKNWAIISGQG